MGKYKQWLHHQEVGRRLRDEIASLEQERERVQQMAPTHATTLPELDNPIVASLLAYTRQGHSLGRPDARSGMAGRGGVDPEQGRPASVAAQPTPVVASGATQGPAVVASLLARAEQMPADPQAQVRDLAQARDTSRSDQQDTAPTPVVSAPGNDPASADQGADSVGGWWRRYRPGDKA